MQDFSFKCEYVYMCVYIYIRMCVCVCGKKWNIFYGIQINENVKYNVSNENIACRNKNVCPLVTFVLATKHTGQTRGTSATTARHDILFGRHDS